MKKIPTVLSGLLLLAKQILDGLKANSGIFSAPPFDLKKLENAIELIQLLNQKLIAAKAALTEAVKEQKDEFKNLDELVRKLVRYIKEVADGNTAILEKGGLSASEGSTSPDRAPGQCTFFDIIFRGDKRVKFKWKRPKTGGTVRFYLIERKNSLTGEWEFVGATEFLEIELLNQPIGIDFDYRVVPTNKIGRGEPSNIASIRF